MNFTVRYRRFLPALLAAGGLTLAFGAASARAQAPLSLANGASGVAINTTSFFGGTYQGGGSATFAFTNSGGTLSGTLYSSVYRNTDNKLDFYYQIALDAANNTSLDSFSLTSFSGSQLSVGQTADAFNANGTPFTANGFAASTANRSRTVTNNGAAVTFFFNDPNTAFTSGRSDTVYLRSDATSFVTTGGSAFFSGGVAANSSGTVATLLPAGVTAAAAPEPGSLALLGTGLMSLGGVMVRRRAKK